KGHLGRRFAAGELDRPPLIEAHAREVRLELRDGLVIRTQGRLVDRLFFGEADEPSVELLDPRVHLDAETLRRRRTLWERVEDRVLLGLRVQADLIDEVALVAHLVPEDRRSLVLVDAVPVRGAAIEALLRARDRDVEEAPFVLLGPLLQLLYVRRLLARELG